MGFFSWKTNDTDRSISNEFSSRGTFTVHMIDDKGNVWTEENYEGYGVFGGKDYYELLAEMNGKTDRDEGISLQFGERHEGVKFPNLVEDVYEWTNEAPEDCEHQGYFYDDDEDEDDDW